MSFNRSGYIGRAPGDSSVTIARKTYEPTGVQTDFTFSAGYDPGYCDVYLNGIRLINGNDYTASNGSTVGLTSAAQNGDIVEVVAYKAFNLGQPLSDITGDLTISDTLTATNVSGTTSITAGTFYGSGSGLTGVASTDYIITGTAATFNSQVKVLNLNVTGVSTVATALYVGSALTANAAGDVETIGILTASNLFVGTGVTVYGSTGIVSATTFYGDGSNLDNVTSTTINNNADNRLITGSGTANTLNGESNLTFNGSTLAVTGAETVSTTLGVGGVVTITDTTDATSTSTGALIISGGVGIAKSLHVGQNVTIGGTLTYEDVTNVDSIGLVTARAGVNVSGGQVTIGTGITMGIAGVATFSGTGDVHLLDNVKLNVGDGSDLQVYHDGTHSYIKDAGTGYLRIEAADYLQLGYSGQSAGFLNCESTSGSVSVNYGGNTKLQTTKFGTVTTGVSTASHFFTAGVCTAASFSGDGSALTGIEAGIGTEALITSGITTVLNLSKQDHKITASGICTITTSGGTEGNSHTIRIINSGIATVGFSSYFKFAGGASPILTKTDGAVNLISFTVNKTATTTGITTELLTSVANNFS